MIPQAAGRDPTLNDPKPPSDGTGGLGISAGSILWPRRKGTGGFAAEGNILRFYFFHRRGTRPAGEVRLSIRRICCSSRRVKHGRFAAGKYPPHLFS
jgi:hypothetical protein